jgi:hypothetical protein
MALKLLSMINEVESISQPPTIRDVNKLLQGIQHWLAEIQYPLINVTRGPQVGKTNRAVFGKFGMGSRILKIYVDISDDWEWKVIIALFHGDEEVTRHEYNEVNPDVEAAAQAVKVLLKQIPRLQTKMNIEETFKAKLFLSQRHILEAEYDAIFK